MNNQNNQTLYGLDKAINQLNKTIQNAVEFLLRSSNVEIPPLTTHDLKEAIRDLDERIKVNADDPISYINRGNAYFYIRDYERAISDYSEVIKIHPDSAKAYLSRGYAHFRNGEYNMAIPDYSEAIRIDPAYAGVYEARSAAYKHIGKRNQQHEDEAKAFSLGFDEQDCAEDQCFELIEDLVQFCPKNAKVYYYRGLVHDCRGNYNSAISDYSAAIRLDPKYAEAYHSRGTIYYSAYEEDRAIADYNEAIQLYDAHSSGRAKVIRDRGMIYENRETICGYSKAIADYEWAARYELALDVYFQRGKLYAEDGNYDSAIADMSRIIELDDSISTDYDEGFRRGPEYDPDSYPSNYGSEKASEAYNNRSFYHFKKGAYDLAIENFAEVFRLYSETYNSRGFYHFKEGAYDLAIEDFIEVLRLYNERVELSPESNPDFAAIYLNLGRAYYAKQDYDRAIENYDNVVRLCPNYETDFIESKFLHGGQDAVEVAIKLLKSSVNTPLQNADDFYYTGVEALFGGDGLSAKWAFKIARHLGYGDRTKIEQHLTNFKNRE